MSGPRREAPGAGAALEGMREDALCAQRREDLARSLQVQRAAERAPADGLEAALVWVAELRELFGDPAVDRTPWPERVFRL
jgi:hypothetical protein